MYIGIDIGTSGVKALLIDSQQTVVGTAHAPLTVSHPHFGWSEQAPEDWLSAVEQSLGALTVEHPNAMGRVCSISLSGQMHGATLLDAQDKVLRPCILWNDTRSHQEAKALDEQAVFRQISGNIVFPGFTAPKLLWVKKNEPEIFKRVAKVLLPKDYVRLWLTGEYASDASDASGTAWLDVKNRCWSTELLDASDMTEEQMPCVIEGTDASGTLRAELCEKFGIPRHAIISGGGGDNATSACGMGVIKPGSAFVSLGTSGVLFTVNAEFKSRPESAVHAFCHAIPSTWHQMGVILSATDSINWFAQLVNKPAEKLAHALGQQLSEPTALRFLPYLSGERTPHNDAQIRGAFIGLSHRHDERSMTQAIVEGVSFAIRDNLEAIQQTGTRIERITAVGGGSKSKYWLQSIATALNVPVDVPGDSDFGGAFGAARLAMAAAHTERSLDETFSPPEITETIEPVCALHDVYEEAYLDYRSLYPKLKAST